MVPEPNSNYSEGRKIVLANRSASVIPRTGPQQASWTPGYLQFIDSRRVDISKIKIDPDTPGDKGVSDADVCWQVAHQGCE
jgi:hypothetical protein